MNLFGMFAKGKVGQKSDFKSLIENHEEADHVELHPGETIDDALGGADMMRVSELIKALPEESPNMAWRSQLSSAIMAEAASKRKKRRQLKWASTGFGLAVATCFAFVAVFTVAHRTTASLKELSPSASQSFEAALVQVHEETSTTRDVTGNGLSASDMRNATASDANTIDQEDVGDL